MKHKQFHKEEVRIVKGIAADLKMIYRTLEKRFGSQHWWPAETPFEVMVGAILTQNTNWKNVEKAISNLKTADVMNPRRIAEMKPEALAEMIRPAGYFNVKAERLQSFNRWLIREFDGSPEKMSAEPMPILRRKLLAIRGVGPETADSILLYACGAPTFVIDAYTRRIFARHGYCHPNVGYDELKLFFESNLPTDATLFSEYHALLVRLGKDYCRPRPLCEDCPLNPVLTAIGKPSLPVI